MKSSKIRRAALICRTSTEQQSTKRQVEELLVLAEEKGYVVEPDDIYEDQISGFSKLEQRPALSKLLENIRSKKKTYDMVFTIEISRLSRKIEEGEKLLIHFRELNIPIYVKNISMCTHLEGEYDREGKLKRNQMFKIVYTLLQEFATTEAEYTRERTISGMRSAKKKGHAGGGVFLPYGFTRDENKMLVIDEMEKDTVLSIFDYASRGYGLKTICNILNGAGIPTKSQKVVAKGTIVTKGTGSIKRVKKVEHVRWEEGTVQKILTNTIYKGERVIKVDEKFMGKDVKAEPVYGTVKVPSIVSTELFDKVQKLRADKFNKRCVDMRFLYLLKNICQCGVCGRNMAGRHKPGPNGHPLDSYYQCSSKRSAHTNCGNVSVSIEAIESTVWDLVKHSHQMFEHLKSTGGKLKEANDKMDLLMDEIRFQEKNIENLEKEKVRLRKMFTMGMFDDNEEEFQAEWKKLEKQVSNAKNSITLMNRQKVSLAETRVMLSNMDTYIETLTNIRQDRFQAANILNNILEKVIVTSVDRHKNNRKYIVSVYIKDMLPPLTVMLETKQRNQQNSKFILDTIGEKAGQNRFKYIEFSDSDLVKYNDQGILITPIEELETILENQEHPPYYMGKLQQNNYGGNLCKTDESYGDEYEYFAKVETIPRLLPFEEKNAVEDVKAIKEKQKAQRITV